MDNWDEELQNTRYQQIEQLIAWKKLEEARKLAVSLIQDTPDDPNAIALLAHICLHQDQYDQALHWAGQSLRHDPENTLAWFVRSNTYYTMEHWKSAMEAIVEGQRIDPYEPHYFFLRANICNKTSKFEEARDLLLKALEISPENALYLANLSYNEALLRHFPESRLLASKALRLEVESDLVYLYLAWSAERRNDYDDYLNMLKNAIRLDPDDQQIRKEYMEGLQKTYKLYRVLLYPSSLAKRMKPWQVLVIWIGLWIIFRPLVIVFIVLYYATYWITRLMVHVKLFGWNFRR
ncbi:lipopolysaccharide assembly protein LapB [Paenibacillus endophyticus]